MMAIAVLASMLTMVGPVTTADAQTSLPGPEVSVGEEGSIAGAIQSVVFSWPEVAGADGYRVQRATAGAMPYLVPASAAGGVASFRFPLPDGQICVTVQAVAQVGAAVVEGAASDVVCSDADPDRYLRNVPAEADPDFTCVVDHGSGRLSWTDHGADKYWIYRSVDGGRFKWLARSFDTEYVDSPPDGDVRYEVHYRGTERQRCVAAGTAVDVAPGHDLRFLSAELPEGTTFRFTPGEVYPNIRDLTPRSGQRFVAGSTTGPAPVIDGGGAADHAFFAKIGSTDLPTDVEIDGLEFTNYGPGSYQGVVHAQTWREVDNFSEYGPALDWTIANSRFNNNWGYGIYISSGMIIENVSITDNSHLGIGGSGARGLRVTGGELARNSSALADQVWNHSGGLKVTRSTDVVIDGVRAVNNQGPGLWLDIGVTDAEVVNNLVEDNVNVGIYYEISWDGLIAHNTLRRNGQRLVDVGNWPMQYVGIFSSTSDGVEIRDNVITDSHVGVSVLDQALRRNTANGGIAPAAQWLAPGGDDGTLDIYAGRDNVVVGNTVCRVNHHGAYANAERNRRADLEDWAAALAAAEPGLAQVEGWITQAPSDQQVYFLDHVYGTTLFAENRYGDPDAVGFRGREPSINLDFAQWRALDTVHDQADLSADCEGQAASGDSTFVCWQDGKTIGWTDHGADKYWVYRSVDGEPWAWLAGLPDTSYVDTTQPDGVVSYEVHYQGIGRERCVTR